MVPGKGFRVVSVAETTFIIYAVSQFYNLCCMMGVHAVFAMVSRQALNGGGLCE